MMPYKLNDQDILIQHVAGSRLYGLNISSSDEDVRGVYAVPDDWRVFRNLTYNTQMNSSEVSRDGQDDKLYELTHFMELVYKQNPTIMETLMVAPDSSAVIGSIHPAWVELHELVQVKPLVSAKLVSGLVGYASAQLKRLENMYMISDQLDEAKSLKARKHAMHVMRLMFQAQRLMETGKFFVNVPDEYREVLLQIRKGEVENYYAAAVTLFDAVMSRYHAKSFHTSLADDVSLIEIVQLTKYVYSKMKRD